MDPANDGVRPPKDATMAASGASVRRLPVSDLLSEPLRDDSSDAARDRQGSEDKTKTGSNEPEGRLTLKWVAVSSRSNIGSHKTAVIDGCLGGSAMDNQDDCSGRIHDEKVAYLQHSEMERRYGVARGLGDEAVCGCSAAAIRAETGGVLDPRAPSALPLQDCEQDYTNTEKMGQGRDPDRIHVRLEPGLASTAAGSLCADQDRCCTVGKRCATVDL